MSEGGFPDGLEFAIFDWIEDSGREPWEIFDSHPLGRAAPPEQVLPVLAAVAGFLVQRSTLPPPPGLPTLREFQRVQGEEALAWLRRRLES